MGGVETKSLVGPLETFPCNSGVGDSDNMTDAYQRAAVAAGEQSHRVCWLMLLLSIWWFDGPINAVDYIVN